MTDRPLCMQCEEPFADGDIGSPRDGKGDYHHYCVAACAECDKFLVANEVSYVFEDKKPLHHDCFEKLMSQQEPHVIGCKLVNVPHLILDPCPSPDCGFVHEAHHKQAAEYSQKVFRMSCKKCGHMLQIQQSTILVPGANVDLSTVMADIAAKGKN